ncbi:MAG: hypothetical protein K2L45_05530 [Muribaculaceae bacterium]|nr:hypothetical protein [Muribaculaceae bacterium]MDE6633192.1 hypothetical protein [Muribaculaceae bacterium]
MKKFTLMCAAVAATMSMNAQTPLTAEMWHQWTGWGADATIVEDGEVNCEYNVGKELGQMEMVIGPESCNGDLYADLTEYAGIEGEATPGITVRLYFNRQELQGPGLDIRVNTDAEGKFSYMFSELGDVEFVHLNFVKITAAWQGGLWPDGLEKCEVKSMDLIKKEVETPQNAITASWWHQWTGWGADATIVEDGEVNCEYNIGKELGQMDMVIGPESCNGDLYADLTGYAGIEGEATPGITVRLYFNRQELQGPGLDIRVNTDADGKFTYMFSELGDVEYVHLNFVKITAAWQGGLWPDGLEKAVVSEFNAIPKGSSSVSAIENADVKAVLYNIYGQRVDESYRGLVIKNGKKYVQK